MKRTRIWPLLLMLCLLSGCLGAGESIPAAKPSDAAFTPYAAPPLADAVFHDTEAVDGIKLDLSAVEQGYIAISAAAERRLKLRVKKGEEEYTYNIASDGTPSIFPLQCGSGDYTFQVWENIEGTKYARIYSAQAAVVLADEFQPFLRPSDYVAYTADSQAVKTAAELAAGCATDAEVIRAVYEYVCANISYDDDKAETVPKGYLPDPDETLRTGKGICFDYAALTAAMLRSQGIPAKVVFGYTGPDDTYHAWNMVYADSAGRITQDFAAAAGEWNRLDPTLAASGVDSQYISNDKNYVALYLY